MTLQMGVYSDSMTPDVLHVRMEGRVGELENATAALETLARALGAGPWERSLPAVRDALRAWRALREDLGAAKATALRTGALEAVRRLEDAQLRVDSGLAACTADTAIARADTFERRLEVWLELAERTGSARKGRPLAVASSEHPTRWSLAVWAVGLALVFTGTQNLVPAGLLLLLGALARRFVREQRLFRLFPDALELDDSARGVFQVPLASLESTRASPGHTLRGLRDVALGTGSQFNHLCVMLNDLLDERRVLEKEQLVVREEPPETSRRGWWVCARLAREQSRVTTTVELAHGVELVKFEKGPAPLDGWGLLGDHGLLFLPDDAEEIIRRMLFDTRKVSLLRALQQPLDALPASLFLDRLSALEKVRDVHVLAPGAPVAWTSNGKHHRAVLPFGTLSLTLDEDSRASLGALWPADH
jgi:hypothetical protein